MSDSYDTGWYGKLPANGDFVTRRLPAAFIEPWDAWLNAMLAGSREQMGAGWRDAFLSAPAWRFVLAPGVIGLQGWAGLVVPSVDSVGRSTLNPPSGRCQPASCTNHASRGMQPSPGCAPGTKVWPKPNPISMSG